MLVKDQPVYLSDGVSMKRANRRSRTENKINQRKTLYKSVFWNYTTEKSFWSSWVVRFYLENYGWAKALTQYNQWLEEDFRKIQKIEGKFKDKLTYEKMRDNYYKLYGEFKRQRVLTQDYVNEILEENLIRRKTRLDKKIK